LANRDLSARNALLACFASRGPDVRHDQWSAGLEQGTVKAAQDVEASGGFDADHDPVRFEGVADGHALSKELGVGCHMEPESFALSLERGPDPICRPGGDRRLLHDDDVVLRVAGDLTRRLLHRHEVRLAVGARRCAHADEHDLRFREGARRIEGEGQSTG
jgi:hypothetical protein